MSKQNKIRLTIVFVVLLLIALFFWLRRNPNYAQTIQNVASAIPQIPGITVPSESLSPMTFNFPNIAPWQAPPINNYITNVPGEIAALVSGNNNNGNASASLPGAQGKGTCSLCTASANTSNIAQPMGSPAVPATIDAPYQDNYPLLGAPPPLAYSTGGVGRRPVW